MCIYQKHELLVACPPWLNRENTLCKKKADTKGQKII